VIDGAVAVAFAAGLVATINPCGFAMLPAYLAYFLGEDDAPVAAGPGRALRTGAIVSLGFLAVFGVAGVVATVALRQVVQAVPWAAIVVGVLLVIYGLLTVLGRAPQLRLPGPTRAVEGRSPASLFTFGVAYAIASLSCTLPVFLSVVGGAMARGTVLEGIALFAVYAAGMSLVLLVLAVAVASGRDGIIRWMRRGSSVATKASGALLTIAGAYIVWFWAGNVQDPLAARGPVQTVEGWSSTLINLVAANTAAVTLTLTAIVVLAAVASAVRGRRDRDDRHDDARSTAGRP
jgi:cytochrome c-type biogenesis protein